MAKWEYMMTDEHDRRRPHKILTDDYGGLNTSNPSWEIGMEEWLNQLGNEGWEVVAAGGGGAGGERYTEMFFTIILKREISD
jgi:hypothetical protein